MTTTKGMGVGRDGWEVGGEASSRQKKTEYSAAVKIVTRKCRQLRWENDEKTSGGGHTASATRSNIRRDTGVRDMGCFRSAMAGDAPNGTMQAA